MNSKQPIITNEIVNQAIDFILEHAGEEVTLEDVAKHCHFSKYYFSRLFKEQTGESVYGYIKRVKLEQSAFCLKTQRQRSITQISADYGYSASNYSSAFKLHYQMTPMDFRRSSYRKSMRHPFFHHEKWEIESFEECNRNITIEQVPDYYVIYERRFGSYERLSGDWDGFQRKYQDYVTEQTTFLERTWDDPAVTQADNCLYDICMSVSFKIQHGFGAENALCIILKDMRNTFTPHIRQFFWCGCRRLLISWMKAEVYLTFITGWIAIRCIWNWIFVCLFIPNAKRATIQKYINRYLLIMNFVTEQFMIRRIFYELATD